MGLRDLIPFIGFRRMKADMHMARELGITHGKPVDGDFRLIWVEAFEVSWLGCGLTLAVRECR